MGNANMTGSTPKAKTKDAGICSTGKWDGVTVSDDVKNKLKKEQAYIEIDEFCAPSEEAELIGTAIGVGIAAIATGGAAAAALIATGAETEGFEALSSNASLQQTLCTNLGDNYQWVPYDYPFNGCTYNDCDPGYKVDGGSGCNGKCCGIVGGTVGCARIAFSGDPVVCCFNDYACDENEDKCFQTPERQATCDPSNRDITSKKCKDLIEPYCIGDSTFAGQNDWMEMWLENSSVPINSNQELSSVFYPATKFSSAVTVADRGKRNPLSEKQPCLRAIARNITMGNICSWDDIQEGEIITSNVNESGLTWSRTMLDKVYLKYKQESGGGGLLAGINTDGIRRDAGFYKTLWNICNKGPMLCTNGADENPEGILPDLCSNITTEDIIKTPEALKWCACHMPKEQYEEYSNRYGIPKECTPMCNRLGIIPSIDVNGERKFCQDNTCIIDDNNINLTNSEISGGVNFNQLCPGCGKNNVDRKFTRDGGESSSNSSDTSVWKTFSFTFANPLNRDFLANYYNNVYEAYFARENFSSNKLFAKVLYLPEEFFSNKDVLSLLTNGIKTQNTKPFMPLNIIDDTMQSKLRPYFKGWTSKMNLKQYLVHKYGISEVVVIFGVLQKTVCIGYTDAGFTIKLTATSSQELKLKEAIYTQSFRPHYFSEKTQIQGQTAGTVGYHALLYDFSKQCVSPRFPQKGGNGFKSTSNTLYSETIVSETSNKFSSGSVDGKVKSNTCTCVMDGVNLTTVNSKINGSINFTQECGQSKCTGPDGSSVSCADTTNAPVPHDSIEAIELKTAIQLEEEKYSKAFYILATFAILVLIIILFFELFK